MKPSPTVIWIAAWGALLAKLCCAVLTAGSNDIDTFYNFGRFIWENGLLEQYRATREFNHTPLVGWYCAAIYGIGKGAGFHLLLRLPGIIADFLVVRTLLTTPEWEGRFPRWAFLLFALSPVNFMVSGFHGNVDSVLAWLVLLAARECGRGRAVGCGLFLALACQVKVIPLLLAPAFFFFWLARRRARPFFLTAGIGILAGWAFPLIQIPELFLSNVLGYSSNWGSWGITYWLHATGMPVFGAVGFLDLLPPQVIIMTVLKLVIVAGALGIAWHRRNVPAQELFTTLLLVWAVFFVFAPGVGAQYLVWFAPLLLIQFPRWFAVITLASAAFLFAFYTIICGGVPWFHGVSTAELLSRWVGWSALPWLALTAFLVATLTAHEAKRLPKAHSESLDAPPERA